MEGRTVSHYEVMDRLGRGGMGEVYRARDLQLERTVALKFLPADVGEHPEMRERFLREARAASALDHPRICTVYEIGATDDGQPFISMAYCGGETLKARLCRGRLPPEEARAIAIQIVEGLAAAHEAGVVHRDVKPANIMLTPGGVKILDFGLAKLADATLLTHTGATMGTPAYMSPEQATGKPIDGRTDIWSLGAILYEMVTGTRPFKGDNATAIMYAILSDDLRPVRELRPDVPDDLESVISGCLVRDPGERYADCRAVLVDLGAPETSLSATRAVYDVEQTAISGDLRPRARSGRAIWRPWWWFAAAAAVGLAVTAGWWMTRSPHGDPSRNGAALESTVTAPLHVVGVAPFVNRTGDDAYDWHGAGIAQLVTDALAGSRMLRVISSGRVGAVVEGGAADPSQAASELGLTALVTGEILPAADGVVVAARVVETGSGRSMAAHRADGLDTGTLLGCVDEISSAARRGLGLPPEDSVDVYTADFAVGNPEAYRSYVEGLRAFADWRYEDAEREFRQALALAPDFSMARYRLAWVLAATSRRDEAADAMRRAAEGASRMSDREARYVRAGMAELESRLENALAEYRRLVELYPYDTDARHLLAGVLHDLGRYEEEVAELETLAGIAPDDAVVHSMLGYAHLARGDATGAIVALQRYVELEPDSANGHHTLGDAYRAQGELELAAEEYRRSLAVDPHFHFASTSLAVVEVLQGRLSAAESRLRAVIEDRQVPPRGHIDAGFELASLLRLQGRFRDAETALRSLQDEIEGEGVREALWLSVCGSCLLELGELRSARQLIERAVERSPGVPTRYLFARGQLELRNGEPEAARATAARIAEGALPSGEADRTEDKAAAYLRGMALLTDGDAAAAVDQLTLAVTLTGYEYAVYRLGLARAYLDLERMPEARAAARQAHNERDGAEPRLDLLLGRHRALITLARIERAEGRPEKAAARAREFLALWSRADEGLPDLAAARELARGR